MYRQLQGIFPSPIPTGMTEFNAWVDSLIAIYTLPTADRDSIVFAVASMIMHLGPTTAYKPKLYFVLALRSGAAKQIAHGAFSEIKMRQQAALAQKPAEVTATAPAVTSNGPQK